MASIQYSESMDYAALKELMAAKSSWEEERRHLLTSLKIERTVRKQAQTKVKDYEDQIESLNRNLKAKDAELQLAQQCRVAAPWRLKTIKTSECFENELQRVLAQRNLLELERKDELIAQLTATNVALEAQILEKETQLQEMEMQLVQREAQFKPDSDTIAALQARILDIEERSQERMAEELKAQEETFKKLIKEKEVQLSQREAEFKTQLAALDSDMSSQLASKEETIEELQNNTSQLEQQWSDRLTLLEDQVQNRDNVIIALQALLSVQERSPEEMTSVELKAQKKIMKKLIKEKEAEEKRQKKEKKVKERKRWWF